ncbi:MAG: hypothetical protein LKG27_03960 [Clostridiaceae bacterium]|nr:hypothetical protein [Clostridiaceae bacterium]
MKLWKSNNLVTNKSEISNTDNCITFNEFDHKYIKDDAQGCIIVALFVLVINISMINDGIQAIKDSNGAPIAIFFLGIWILGTLYVFCLLFTSISKLLNPYKIILSKNGYYDNRINTLILWHIPVKIYLFILIMEKNISKTQQS